VLKKAGLIVAATAAGLFAVAPLAFASPDDKGGDTGTDLDYTSVSVDSHDCGNQAAYQEAASLGLLNLIPIAAQVPIDALNCNDILNNVNVLSNEVGDDTVEG
jgi:hypothetical protein